MNPEIGVLPLVCVLCEHVVGVINTAALAAMLGSGEAYICEACAASIYAEPAANAIEAYLELLPPSHYGNLVNCAIAEANNVRA